MNTRIKELYKQARKIRLSTDDFVLETWEQEFARSIIAECARVVSENDFEGSSLGERLLFDHFGVKP